MTNKVYKTAQGQMIDMGALALKNENVLAVSPGGGKVNARGDRLDDNNRVIDSKSAQVKRQMEDQTQQIQTASNQRVFSSTRAAKAALEPQQSAPVQQPTPVEKVETIEIVEEVIAGLDDQFNAAPTITTEPIATSNEGLAAAIAKAKNKKAKE